MVPRCSGFCSASYSPSRSSSTTRAGVGSSTGSSRDRRNVTTTFHRDRCHAEVPPGTGGGHGVRVASGLGGRHVPQEAVRVRIISPSGRATAGELPARTIAPRLHEVRAELGRTQQLLGADRRGGRRPRRVRRCAAPRAGPRASLHARACDAHGPEPGAVRASVRHLREARTDQPVLAVDPLGPRRKPVRDLPLSPVLRDVPARARRRSRGRRRGSVADLLSDLSPERRSGAGCQRHLHVPVGVGRLPVPDPAAERRQHDAGGQDVQRIRRPTWEPAADGHHGRRRPLRPSAHRVLRRGQPLHRARHRHDRAQGMKIAEVRPLVMGDAWRNLTFVVVRTDDGLEGVCDVRMVNHTSALLGYLEEAVPTHVIGADPFAFEALARRMIRDDYARAGQIAMSALAVIDMACWDIVGKALGVPVYQLLGGPIRDRIPTYANGWYTVERVPEDIRDAARAAVAKGYRAVKLDPFGTAWQELPHAELRRAIALVEAAREGVGPDGEVFVEMHGRFTPAQAIAIARELEPYRPGWIEEPVPPDNISSLVKVARKVNVPVATGERIHVRHEFREIFERRAADVIQPDLTMMGGISETRKLATWAESYDVMVAPHNVGGPVSTAAALHLAAAMPNFKILEHFNDFVDPFVSQAARGIPTVTDGSFSLPQGPGLGITLDEDVIAAHPRRPIHLNLFGDRWHLRGRERERV